MTKKESQEKLLTMLNDYNTAIKEIKSLAKEEKEKRKVEILLVATLNIAFQDVCEAIGIEFEKENDTLKSVKNWGFIAE